jgi:PAS domain S-box-containing protein
MAFSLRNIPIKRKLMLVILLTSGFAILLMGTALIFYEVETFRRALTSNIEVLAQIIGSNSTAALAFDDRENAKETLRAVAAEHQITAAAIYDRNGRLFVSFPEKISPNQLPSTPGLDGHRFDGAHLVMVQPVFQEGSRLGTIYLEADLSQMYRRLSVYGILLLVVSVCSFLGAMALSAALQRRISLPILELAEVATAVSERHDYSVRAAKHGTDEIGYLTEAFNQMLSRIGESNAALAAGEEQLRLALEGSRTGTWDWNLLTNRVTWDDFMYPLFGLTKADFDGTIESVLPVVHPDDRSKLKQALRDAAETKQDLNIDFRVIDSDGATRYMASRGRVFFDHAGTPVRMTGVSMDVTASKQIEEALSRAKEAAELANKEKDQFLAIVSHELRTPLTPALAATAMLESDQTLPQQIRQDLAVIRRNIEMEARLIDDLLDINRIVRGKLELRRQVVDARSLLEHAMQNYCLAAAAKKDICVSMKIAAEQTHVFVDSSRMTQVFWNLLQNACKFTPSGGSIAVRVYNDYRPLRSPNLLSTNGETDQLSEFVVEISDSGMGISPETLPRIFNAFEQGERSRGQSFGGLGLGLAISRAIIELHGGTISAASEGKGKGATFTVRLYCVKPVLDAETDRQVSAISGAIATRSMRVLVVEDHRDTAEQFARLLKHAGHEVICAGSIKEAQTYALMTPDQNRACPFDILISDLDLPDGSGLELMRNLAQRYPIRGIVVSGHGMKEDIEGSLEAGFSYHITKPVNWAELKSAIEKIAEEVHHEASRPAPKLV